MAVHVAQTYGYGTRGSRVGMVAPDPYLQRQRRKRAEGGNGDWDDAAREDNWRARAACRDLQTDLFFPSMTGTAGDVQVAAAREWCDPCPVLLQCRRYGLADRSIQHGIWGGIRIDEINSRTRTLLLAQTRRQLKEPA
jgi:WhiB family redox-sensing transcriptional regulator